MTVTKKKVYNHRAIPWRPEDDAPVECRRCGDPVIGYDPATTRHVGEVLRNLVQIQPAHVPAFDAATAAIRDALDKVPDDAPSDAVADAVARELYARGALKERRGSWRPATARTAA